MNKAENELSIGQNLGVLFRDFDVNKTSNEDLVFLMKMVSNFKEGEVSNENVVIGFVELGKLLKERKDYVNLLRCVRKMLVFQRGFLDVNGIYDDSPAIKEIFGITLKDMEDMKAYVLDYMPSFRIAKFEGRFEAEPNLKNFYETMKDALKQEKDTGEEDQELLQNLKAFDHPVFKSKK